VCVKLNLATEYHHISIYRFELNTARVSNYHTRKKNEAFEINFELFFTLALYRDD